MFGLRRQTSLRTRGARTFPEDLRLDLVMDDPQYVVLSFGDGSRLTTTNPFTIADELRRLIGEVESAKPTSSGNLLIKTKTRQQALTLMGQDRFLDKPATFEHPDRLNSVEAYAYAPSLTEVTEDQLLEELKAQGVIGVTRLRPRSGTINPGIRFRFRGRSFPEEIRAGFEDIPLRTWRRSPMLCRRCAAYGHTAKHCKAKSLRCLRCADKHCTEDCKTDDLNCPHCEGAHAAWDRKCPILAKFFAAQDSVSRNYQEPVEKKDATSQTQTKTSSKDAATGTTQLITRSAGAHKPTTYLSSPSW